MRVHEGHDEHTGYNLPWSLFRLVPYCSDAKFHDFHHSNNTGNFSSFLRVWDSLFDTECDWYIA